MAMSVAVETMEALLNFEIPKAAKGQVLYNQVLEKLGLHEEPLFGLQYTDHKGFLNFIKLDKKIAAHKRMADSSFQLRAKYFPEQIAEELKSPLIRRLFWLQIRDGVQRDEIYCPAILCVLFAAQSMQADHGDFDPARHARGVINANSLLPARVLAQYNLSALQWEEKIAAAWREQRGLDRERVMLDYLSIAQDLEQYGVTYFEVSNKRGTRLWLGVHSLGMDVYRYGNKVTPELGFPWNEIRNISFTDKKFRIQMTSSQTDFKFYAPRFRINKRILSLCVGNHQLFQARRRAQGSMGDAAEDRAAEQEKIKATRALMDRIKEDLRGVHDASKVTREDQLHEEQERQGMDKFKTMKRAQAGDAQKRVLEFNNLEGDADA